MPVVLTQDLPVPVDMLSQVSKEMGVAEDPPEGLIVHVIVPRGETSRVIDIWESQAHFERFREDRLEPAINKVMQTVGAAPPENMPEPTFDEAVDLVRGR